MKFTTEEIMERMNAYVNYAHRIKEIKDLLLDFEIYGDEDVVTAAMRQQDELLKEIHTIYQDRMLPIVEEVARYVNENRHLLNQPRPERSAEELSQLSGQVEQQQEGTEDSYSQSRASALTMGSAFLSSIKDEKMKKHE
ncbi:MAG: hypothetical protein AB9903_08450 [Vulcanimicrobiota bacterium]